MNTATAAQTAGVAAATIRIWCRRNVISAVKRVGQWVIDAASLAYRITLGARKERTMQITAETMVAIGGSHWQRGDKDRVYLNDWAQFIGLEVERYKSGNIWNATLNGETISNGEAGRLLGAVHKVFFDNTDDQLHIEWGHSNPRSMDRDEIAAKIFGGIREAIAAL